MKIYGISGLGADKRVFKHLKLDYELIPIDWVEPQRSETLKDYALRLSKKIDHTSAFSLLGVSFGGLIAIEISKFFNPSATILISSAETRNELRLLYRVIGQLDLINILPRRVFDPPRGVANFVFGAKNKALLQDILDDTDLDFAKWAVDALTKWDNDTRPKNVIRIHGTRDKLLPWRNKGNGYLIKGGEHFMIVDHAEEISAIIGKEIKNSRTKISKQ